MAVHAHTCQEYPLSGYPTESTVLEGRNIDQSESRDEAPWLKVHAGPVL